MNSGAGWVMAGRGWREAMLQDVLVVRRERRLPPDAFRRGQTACEFMTHATRGHLAGDVDSAPILTDARIDSKIVRPSVEPLNGSTACSGCGIRPKTLPASLTMPAMSSWEP